jgi:hypothetical protein
VIWCFIIFGIECDKKIKEFVRKRAPFWVRSIGHSHTAIIYW